MADTIPFDPAALAWDKVSRDGGDGLLPAIVQDADTLRVLMLGYMDRDALAATLASGRVTLNEGRIGISGSVLFALNSAELQAEGRLLLAALVPPLGAYLGSRDEMLMVSGFTDDRPVLDSNRRFADNWELSAQRALTVTRALIDEGIPAASVFAAAFGAQQPVASNVDDDGRARNRRVEMAPVPRTAPPTSPPEAGAHE